MKVDGLSKSGSDPYNFNVVAYNRIWVYIYITYKKENYSCKFKHIKDDAVLNQLPFIIYHDTVFNDMITYPYLIKCAECTVIKGRVFYSEKKAPSVTAQDESPGKLGVIVVLSQTAYVKAIRRQIKKDLEYDCMAKLVLANF